MRCGVIRPEPPSKRLRRRQPNSAQRAAQRAAGLTASGQGVGTENFVFLSRLQPSTRARYFVGSTRVTKWAQVHRRSLAFSPVADRCALDLTLEKFVEGHYQAGEGIAEVRNAIWGYVHTHRLPLQAAEFADTWITQLPSITETGLDTDTVTQVLY